jgi:hypothetical protein
MALSFPYETSAFADLIRMTTVRMRLVPTQQVSRGAGSIIVADMAEPFWEFTCTLINQENKDSRRLHALINALDGSLNDFYLYDPRYAYPILDPDGTLLGASAVKINSLDANNKELTLKGLPPGYVLSAGDCLHFDFGSSPVNRALHMIAVGGTADEFGVSPSLEVRPHILPGAAVNADVTLIKASARVKIVPESLDEGTGRQMMTGGMGFKCWQVTR